MTEQCLLPVDRQSECKNHMASHVSERKIADALIERGWPRDLRLSHFPSGSPPIRTLPQNGCNVRVGDNTPGILCKSFQLRKRRIPGNSAFVTTMVW